MRWLKALETVERENGVQLCFAMDPPMQLETVKLHGRYCTVCIERAKEFYYSSYKMERSSVVSCDGMDLS